VEAVSLSLCLSLSLSLTYSLSFSLWSNIRRDSSTLNFIFPPIPSLAKGISIYLLIRPPASNQPTNILFHVPRPSFNNSTWEKIQTCLLAASANQSWFVLPRRKFCDGGLSFRKSIARRLKRSRDSQIFTPS
jgi:hypothetical protein